MSVLPHFMFGLARLLMVARVVFGLIFFLVYFVYIGFDCFFLVCSAVAVLSCLSR